jgi:hypothetical protein
VRQAEPASGTHHDALLRVLVDIQERYIIEGLSRAWWDFVLARVISLTGAEFGFIGRVAELEGRPVLHTLGISNIAWNDWSREVYETYAEVGLTFDNPASLFGVTITDQVTVIANDPAHDPRSGGLPEGHPPLVAYAGIPLSDRFGMVGMLGLANRPGGFSEAFVDELRPLTTFIGEIVGREILARANAETVAQLAETEPLLHEGLLEIAAAWDTSSRTHVVDAVWPLLPKIAIDYSVAEPAAAAGRLAVVRGEFAWDDVGDFSSLAKLLSGNRPGELAILGEGARVLADSSSGVVVSQSSRLISLIGVTDIVVVDTPDALLVTTREHAQRVKSVVDAIKQAGRDDLL